MTEQKSFETWAIVVDFDGTYEVSSIGRVRRVGTAHKSGKGHGGGARVGHLNRIQTNKGGYQFVQLWKCGKPYTRLVHVLVSAAFLGPCPKGQEVNHKDGCKSNNCVTNLEYVTRSQNMKHAYRMGLRIPSEMPRGTDHHNAKLNEQAVSEIRSRYRRLSATNGSVALGREFGVDHSTILRVVREETWNGK